MTNFTATPSLASTIEEAFERRADISPGTVDPALTRALDEVIAGLNSGALRVAEKRGDGWVTHQWLKKAVLLYFRTRDNQLMPAIETLLQRRAEWDQLGRA
jgi:2,3,4,5-tetrahydropyridine-2-carboxylate N-succinyltransferase